MKLSRSLAMVLGVLMIVASLNAHAFYTQEQKSNSYATAATACGGAVPKTIVAGVMVVLSPVLIPFMSETRTTVDSITGEIRFEVSFDKAVTDYFEEYVFNLTGLRKTQACRTALRQIFKMESMDSIGKR